MRTTVALARERGDLRAANAGRELVEHAVHVLVPVGAAVGLREIDRLVDDDPVGDVRAMRELPGAQREDRALDRGQLRRRAVEQWRQTRDERLVFAGRTVPQLAKVGGIGGVESAAFDELEQDR